MIDLDFILIVSLGVLAFLSFCTLIIIVPVVLQLSRTLTSLQHLTDTINDDLKPTVNEIKESVGSIKNVFKKGTDKLKSTTYATGIMAISSVHGILKGLKAYLSSYKNNETSYNSNQNKEVQRR